jgi:hypothetical protein
MRWRQASESAHPEPILLRGNSGPAPDQRPSGPRNGPGRTPDLRIQDQPGRKRCLRASALPPAQKELRFRRGRAGPGFGPGAANQAWTQGFGLWPCQAEPRLRPRILPDAVSRASAGEIARARKRNASSESAERRTARASALTGSPRGTLKGLRPWTDSGGCGARTQFWLPPLETAHCERPASAEPDAKGQWGPAAMPGPITVWGWQRIPPARHSRESGNLPAFPGGQGERKWDSGFRRNDEREWAVRHSPHCRTGPTWINPLSPLPSPQPA